MYEIYAEGLFRPPYSDEGYIRPNLDRLTYSVG